MIDWRMQSLFVTRNRIRGRQTPQDYLSGLGLHLVQNINIYIDLKLCHTRIPHPLYASRDIVIGKALLLLCERVSTMFRQLCAKPAVNGGQQMTIHRLEVDFRTVG